MYKILIVEDDIDLKEGLEFALKEDGYEVLVAETKKMPLYVINPTILIWF